MFKAAGLVVLGAIVTAGSICEAAEKTNAAPASVQIQLDLVDGSRVIGVPKMESVSAQSAYAKMEIPLSRIHSMAVADDHKTVTIDMRNGDSINAGLAIDAIGLDTLFGAVNVRLEHVRRLSVDRKGEKLSVDLARALQLYYSFEGNDEGKARDVSGKGNDGVLRGAKWIADGISGGACALSGGKACIDAGAPQAQAGSISVSVWIRTTQVLEEQRWVVARSAWQTGAWQLMTHNGKAAAEFDPGGMFVGNSTIADGKWHNVIAVYDDSTHARLLYVDGELDGEDRNRGAFTENGNPVCIRRRPDTSVCFDGALDEIMIFSRALSPAEVRQVHGAGWNQK